ncbi:MAG: hypothetical protein ABJH05_17770 [Fulvivirga sp.]
MLASLILMYSNYIYCNLPQTKSSEATHEHADHEHQHDNHDHQSEPGNDEDCCTDLAEDFFNEGKVISHQLRISQLVKYVILNNIWTAFIDLHVVTSFGNTLRFIEPPPPRINILVLIQKFII